jgi:prolipoprotein diacylglyceryltransferase
MVFGFGIFGLIALACAVLVIYDVVVKQKKMKDNKKVLWIIFAVLFSIITAIVYYLVIKKKK